MSDYRTTTGEPLPEGSRQRRRSRQLWVRRGVLVLCAVALAGFVIPVRVRVAANGYVTTDDYAEVRPAVAGPVAEILGTSGQHVEKGDVLVRLDDRVQQAALDETIHATRRAEAMLESRTAELEQTERQRQHQLAQAQRRLEHAESTLKMTEELHARGLASGSALEDRRAALALSRAEYNYLTTEDPTLADKELNVLQRELEQKQSTTARARAELEARHIVAPISGDLVRYEFVPGELVTPQSVLYEVFGGPELILKLRIPERYAALVKPGAPYKAVLSIYTGPGREQFKGTVSALRSVIQSDNQQTYRMAYCNFDDAGLSVPPGTSAEARITVSRAPFWFWMFGVR